MDPSLTEALLTAVVSASVASGLLGYLLLRRATRVEEEVKSMFAEQLSLFQSNLAWQQASLAELMDPVAMQLWRTEKAFKRWQANNLYLETEVIWEGNATIRDLLLTKGHLVPPELRPDAVELIAHYDQWLEAYARVRGAASQEPDAKSPPFVFTYNFPRPAANHFLETYATMWSALYGPMPPSSSK